MTQKSLSKWLKGIILGMAVCGLIIFGVLVPLYGQMLAEEYPEFAYCYYPWLIMLWILAILCYLVLYNGWKITAEIAKDNSFSYENARYLKRICILALAGTVYFFASCLVFFFLNMMHPGALIISLFVDFAGVVIAVVTAALSHLVLKAADLQQENDLTI